MYADILVPALFLLALALLGAAGLRWGADSRQLDPRSEAQRNL